MTRKISQFVCLLQRSLFFLFKGSTQTQSDGLSQRGPYDSSLIKKNILENRGKMRIWANQVIDRCRTLNFDVIRSPAVVLGMTGAVLVAMPATKFRMAGFGAWILGNSLWIVHGRRSDDHHVIVMFGFYLVTAIVGLYNLVRVGL